MKYVVVRTPGGEAPVVFARELMHAYVARGLAPAEVVSAGFVALSENGIQCFGASAGLHIRSRGEQDAALITNSLTARD